MIGAVRGGKLLAARGEPTTEVNATWACSPAALAFKDLDADGPEDLLLMMSCMTEILGPVRIRNPRVPSRSLPWPGAGPRLTGAVDRALEHAIFSPRSP